MSAVPLPRPRAIEATEPFWSALRDHRVVLQHCGGCATWIHYPRRRCTTCLSEDLRWEEVSGHGVVSTFTIARQATHPAFGDEVPQLLAVVELDEGVRMTSTLVGVAPEDVHVGMAVVPAFDDGDDGVTLLRFAPA